MGLEWKREPNNCSVLVDTETRMVVGMVKPMSDGWESCEAWAPTGGSAYLSPIGRFDSAKVAREFLQNHVEAETARFVAQQLQLKSRAQAKADKWQWQLWQYQQAQQASFQQQQQMTARLGSQLGPSVQYTYNPADYLPPTVTKEEK